MQNAVNYLLGGQLRLYQPSQLSSIFPASMDAVFLGVSAPSAARVLDVGAGLGTVSLCYAHWHQQAQITALELQSSAYDLLCANIVLNGYGERLQAVRGDLFGDTSLVAESFDLVITNPPYLCSGKHVATMHPERFLAVSENGWTIGDWLQAAFKYLCRKAWFAMIHRCDRLHDILRGFSGLIDRLHVYPLFSKDSAVARRLIFLARKKSSRARSKDLPNLQWHRGLLVHRRDGSYSAEAEAILRGRRALSIAGV